MAKKAQVWISVVIYTLVGLTAIGLLLAVVQPRVKEMRDGITIKQTISALHDFDSSLRSTLIAPGNKRVVEFKISAGELVIDPIGNVLVWSMKSNKKFSEPGKGIQEGTIKILTEEGNPWTVTLTLDYGGVANIVYAEANTEKKLGKAAAPYIISVENLGSDEVGEAQEVNIVVHL